MTENATFGGELRRLRRAAGVSLSRLAELIHYSKGYLSKVENGTSPPNESLASLCDDVLATDGALAALLIDSGGRRRARHAAGPKAPFGLPPVTANFTGRAAEVNEVLMTLRGDVRVCVISGMAGVGKTALAVRCGHRAEARFPDGALFMDLRGHTPDVGEVSPAEALDRFLRLLGVPADAIPGDVDDRAALYRDQLRGRSLLVVLDNACSARQVAPLLPAEAKCRVLVTSRHRLAALDDAHQIKVGLLPAAEGAELLRTLLGSRAADDHAVDRVVELCGRLPLAIRIAAARLLADPSWNVGDLVRRLAVEADRLRELDDGERNVLAVFRLALDSVHMSQRVLFGLLALHPGADLDVHAATALSGSSTSEVERLLGQLRDGHLITQASSGRYHCHDLLRSFAATEVATELSDETRAAAVNRLLATETHAAEAADRLLAPTRYRRAVVFDHPPAPVRAFADSDAALAWFRVEWPNLVALCRLALVKGEHTYCWQLAFSLRSFFFLTKLWDPWIESQRIALTAATASTDTWAQATTLNNLGVAMIDRGELDEAADYYRQALARFRELDDQHGTSTTLANYAWVDHYRGDHRSALQNLRIALDFYHASGAARNAAITLRGMGLVETALHDHDSAVTHTETALDIFVTQGLDLDITMSHNGLGWAHFRGGRFTEAETAYRAALTSCARSGSSYEAARAETGLGNVAAATDRLADARMLWATADDRQIVLDPVMVGEHRARLEFI